MKFGNLLSIIREIFYKEEETGSKERAVERLKLILISDRSNISPQLLENLKEDLISVISRYMDIDVNSLEVFLERDEKNVALTATLPVKRVKRIRGVRQKEIKVINE